MNIRQFTLWDFIVNVVPGVLLLLLLTSLTPATAFNQIVTTNFKSGILAALILLIIGYAVGRSFQEGVSRVIDEYISQISKSDTHQPAIQYFHQEMSKARHEDHPTARRFFLEEALTYFSRTDTESIEDVDERLDDFDLFNLCQEYVISNEIGRTNRFMILSRFHRSLYVMALIGILAHVAAQFVWPALGYRAALNWIQSLILIVIMGIVGMISFKERWYFEQKIADSLVNGFYAARAGS